MISERLMALGEWKVKFRPDWNAFQSFTQLEEGLIQEGDLVFVTPTELRPDQQTLAGLRAAARYSGILLQKGVTDDGAYLSGAGLLWFLGTDELGPLAAHGFETLTQNFDDWMGTIVFGNGLGVGAAPAPFLTGTITDNPTISPRTFRIGPSQFRKQALDAVCLSFGDGAAPGGEYRVNPDATFDAGLATDLFVTTPTVIFEPRGGARDLDIAQLQAIALAKESDASGTPTGWFLVGAGEGETAFTDFSNPLSWVKTPAFEEDHEHVILLSAPDVADATTAGDVAGSHLTQLIDQRDAVSLSTERYDIGQDITAGDTVAIYDPERTIFDTANPKRVAGRVVYPEHLRVHGVTWPVRRGMGVYLYSGAFPTVVTDITPYVDFEDGPTTFEVTAPKKRLVPSPTSPAAERIAADRPELLGWLDYTPIWTATTNPNIGNGQLLGRYLLVGKTLYVQIRLVMGTTTTFGTGPWRWETPLAKTCKTGMRQVLAAVILSPTGSTADIKGIASGGLTYLSAQEPGAPTAGISSASYTWAASWEVCISGVFEVD